jgi:glucokinase
VQDRPGPPGTAPWVVQQAVGDADRIAAVSFGVDIGGTKVLGVALDEADRVVHEARVPTPRGLPGTPGAPVSAIADAVADVVRELGRPISKGALRSGVPLGVGLPGLVERDGRLRFAPNLPAVSGADVSAAIRARVRAGRVFVGNDATLAVLAELRAGAARGVLHGFMVTLGTGIGGGIVADGRVLVGAHGFGGEVGHMVVDPTGPPCPCGQRGCWERFASGGGLGRLAREAALAGRLAQVVALAGGDPELVRGEDVTASALGGDPEALAVMDELGWWVALGLANLTAVLDPSRIVVGGGLAEAGEALMAPTRRAFARLLVGGGRRPEVEIVAASLGERAGAVGAAMLARSGGEW